MYASSPLSGSQETLGGTSQRSSTTAANSFAKIDVFVGPKRVGSFLEMPGKTMKEVVEKIINKYADKYKGNLELVLAMMVVDNEPRELPEEVALPPMESGQHYLLEFNEVPKEEPSEGPANGENQPADAIKWQQLFSACNALEIRCNAFETRCQLLEAENQILKARLNDVEEKLQPGVAGLQLGAEVYAAGLRLGALRESVDLGRRPLVDGVPVPLTAYDCAAVTNLILHGGSRFSHLRASANANFEPPDPEFFENLCGKIKDIAQPKNVIDLVDIQLPAGKQCQIPQILGTQEKCNDNRGRVGIGFIIKNQSADTETKFFVQFERLNIVDIGFTRIRIMRDTWPSANRKDLRALPISMQLEQLYEKQENVQKIIKLKIMVEGLAHLAFARKGRIRNDTLGSKRDLCNIAEQPRLKFESTSSSSCSLMLSASKFMNLLVKEGNSPEFEIAHQIMFEHTRIEAASIKIDYWMDSEALLYYIWEIFKPVWYQAQSLRFSAKTVFLPFIGENFMVELLGAHLQMKPVEISALPFLGENDHWTFIAVSFVSDHAEIGGQLHIKRELCEDALSMAPLIRTLFALNRVKGSNFITPNGEAPITLLSNVDQVIILWDNDPLATGFTCLNNKCIINFARTFGAYGCKKMQISTKHCNLLSPNGNLLPDQIVNMLLNTLTPKDCIGYLILDYLPTNSFIWPAFLVPTKKKPKSRDEAERKFIYELTNKTDRKVVFEITIISHVPINEYEYKRGTHFEYKRIELSS